MEIKGRVVVINRKKVMVMNMRKMVKTVVWSSTSHIRAIPSLMGSMRLTSWVTHNHQHHLLLHHLWVAALSPLHPSIQTILSSPGKHWWILTLMPCSWMYFLIPNPRDVHCLESEISRSWGMYNTPLSSVCILEFSSVLLNIPRTIQVSFLTTVIVIIFIWIIEIAILRTCFKLWKRSVLLSSSRRLPRLWFCLICFPTCFST